MKTTCPVCGSTNSLDALLAHAEGGAAVTAALATLGELKEPLLKYMGLFRSQKRSLKLEKVAKLLNELAPDIARREISHNRQAYPAPRSAWVWAITQTLAARDAGTLTPPLNSHAYLYKVLSTYKPQNAIVPAATVVSRGKVCLPNIKPERMEEYLEQQRSALETKDECYNRLAKEAGII